jgi:LAS superfamily LD-carboxypeptidase LdcB
MKALSLILGALLVLALAGGAYGAWRWQETEGFLTAATEQVASLSGELDTAKSDYKTLEEAFTAEKERNDAFAKQIEDIGGTVGRLDKLSRTDPELVQKYSKVYFLSENYAPEAFEQIPDAFVYGEKDEYFAAAAYPFLKKLLAAAEDDEVGLMIVSAFRSFNTQAALKAQYRVTYGSGANAFSADQGYSEHQLGTTVDFTTRTVGSSFTGFEDTEAYAWLTDNAWRYGFILSYPKDNGYYQYEPWHWRFVGTKLARDLHEDGKDFYELDQRELDSYLAEIFD